MTSVSTKLPQKQYSFDNRWSLFRSFNVSCYHNERKIEIKTYFQYVIDPTWQHNAPFCQRLTGFGSSFLLKSILSRSVVRSDAWPPRAVRSVLFPSHIQNIQTEPSDLLLFWALCQSRRWRSMALHERCQSRGFHVGDAWNATATPPWPDGYKWGISVF